MQTHFYIVGIKKKAYTGALLLGGGPQAVECLPSKCEALISNPSIAKKKKKRVAKYCLPIYL
jgi:hypothetical protein